ncbi:MAG: riboflavin synthase [Desulfovibrio sp.]
MFTGLVQHVGTIEAVEARGGETRFRIRASDLREIVKGESIAMNGACLTVETFGQGWYTAYASRETLGVTNLGALRTGSRVNLERALALGDRLGGHMVSGHVDCLAEVVSVNPAGESREYHLKFPAELGSLVVAKGSVALDGISLTVNRCGADWLSVNIIPATQTETTISSWKPGYQANMEIDIIGRYVQRMLGPYTGDKGHAETGDATEPGAGLSEAFLRRHGF